MSRPAKGHRWPLGIPGTVSSAAAAVDTARYAWLCVLADVEPGVLTDLAAANDDDVGLDAWAARWNLSRPWVLAHARATRREWTAYETLRGRAWADRDDDTGGGWTAHGARVRGTAWYQDAAALRWLARVHLGVATYTGLAHAHGVSTQAVAAACKRLAAFIDLPIVVTRGRPPRVG